MRVVNSRKYMTTGDVGAFINRSQITIVRWCKFSDQLEQRGEKRLIPKPLLINGQRLFTLEQAKVINEFAESKGKYGLMAEFNRKFLAHRGKEIEKRMKAREKEQEKRQEEEEEAEISTTLAKVNTSRAVDYKDRFRRLKKDM